MIMVILFGKLPTVDTSLQVILLPSAMATTTCILSERTPWGTHSGRGLMEVPFLTRPSLFSKLPTADMFSRVPHCPSAAATDILTSSRRTPRGTHSGHEH